MILRAVVGVVQYSSRQFLNYLSKFPSESISENISENIFRKHILNLQRYSSPEFYIINIPTNESWNICSSCHNSLAIFRRALLPSNSKAILRTYPSENSDSESFQSFFRFRFGCPHLLLLGRTHK